MKLKLNVLAMIGLCCLLLGGCARFIVPEIGSVASEESRILFQGGDLQEGLLETDDLKMKYSLSGNDTETLFTGEMQFDRSLTDSFPVIRTFFLKLNWLDAQGVVLDSVDISPLYSYGSFVTNKLKIDQTIPVASGSVAYCFNYYGVFRGGNSRSTGTSDIFLFPFEAP